MDLMQLGIFGVIGLVTIVAAGAFSNRLGVAAPLILIVIGVGFSFIPGAPAEIPHEVILFVLLPPILYSAAISVPLVDFRRNFVSISALSVVLVIVTAVVTGFILFTLFPQLSLASGIAIGAVISPTDAVAATAIARKMGLPSRIVSILEGESLVNDATALVLLRSAIAVAAASVNFWGVIGDFAYAVVVAVIVGLVVGFVTVWVRSKLKDSLLDTAISFAVPFIAFIPAELLNSSGVLAVVVAGIYSGHSSARFFSPQARISERLNWRTVQFVVENGVFLLMGIELSALISGVTEADLSVTQAVLVGFLMVAVLLVIRFAFMPPLLLLLRRQQENRERTQTRWDKLLIRIRLRVASEPDPATPRRTARRKLAEKVVRRRQADVDQLRAEGLGWRGGAVIGWAGMRGVVTLAAAQSLPEGTPYRAQLILIAFTVGITTLLLQGGTLPWLIKLTGIQGSDRTADRRELASLLDDLTAAGVAVLDNPDFSLPNGEAVDAEVVERVRKDTLLAAESAWERAHHGTEDEGLVESPERQYRALRREVLQAEQEALLESRAEGSYPSRIYSRAQSLLDLEQARLEQIDTGGRAE